MTVAPSTYSHEYGFYPLQLTPSAILKIQKASGIRFWRLSDPDEVVVGFRIIDDSDDNPVILRAIRERENGKLLFCLDWAGEAPSGSVIEEIRQSLKPLHLQPAKLLKRPKEQIGTRKTVLHLEAPSEPTSLKDLIAFRSKDVPILPLSLLQSTLKEGEITIIGFTLPSAVRELASRARRRNPASFHRRKTRGALIKGIVSAVKGDQIKVKKTTSAPPVSVKISTIRFVTVVGDDQRKYSRAADTPRAERAARSF